jgi:hypothetical protein
VGKVFAGIVVAIVLLTAGAMYLVSRFTEPLPAAPARAERAAAVSTPSPGSSWPESGQDAVGIQSRGPPGRPTAAGPEPGEPAPAQPPAPAVQPEDSAEGEESSASARAQRRHGLKLNRPGRRQPDGPPRPDSDP